MFIQPQQTTYNLQKHHLLSNVAPFLVWSIFLIIIIIIWEIDREGTSVHQHGQPRLGAENSIPIFHMGSKNPISKPSPLPVRVCTRRKPKSGVDPGPKPRHSNMIRASQPLSQTATPQSLFSPLFCQGKVSTFSLDANSTRKLSVPLWFRSPLLSSHSTYHNYLMIE